MNRVPLTKDELQRKLDEQIELLESAADSFDEGREVQAINLATRLRVLLHDTGRQTSLLKQLGLLSSRKFYDTRVEDAPVEGEIRIGSYSGLAPVLGLSPSDSKYIAELDGTETSPQSGKEVDFDDWWNAVVLDDVEGNKFSRKDIVLYITNQDGGAHVDPSIREDYAKLSRQNSMGRMYKRGAEGWKPLENPHYVTVRQIAHEVLKTLKPEYTKCRAEEQGIIWLGAWHATVTPVTNEPEIPKVGRNDPCPCGSGKKYKKCHGK